jgi:hypothetical protein
MMMKPQPQYILSKSSKVSQRQSAIQKPLAKPIKPAKNQTVKHGVTL